MMSSPTPATLAGMRVHQHRRRVGRLAARHIEADAVERRHLLAQHACRRPRCSSRTAPAAFRGRVRTRAAACSSASRCARGSASQRAREPFARQFELGQRRRRSAGRSARVYSSTAASPRAFHVGQDFGDYPVDGCRPGRLRTRAGARAAPRNPRRAVDRRVILSHCVHLHSRGEGIDAAAGSPRA